MLNVLLLVGKILTFILAISGLIRLFSRKSQLSKGTVIEGEIIEEVLEKETLERKKSQ